MEKPKLVILVVEDEIFTIGALTRSFGDVAELIFAKDQSTAWDLYCQNKSRLDMILMDGNVPNARSERPSFTGNLIKRFREDGYKGFILGMPSDRGVILTMMAAGADEAKEKGEIRILLRQKLGLE